MNGFFNKIATELQTNLVASIIDIIIVAILIYVLFIFLKKNNAGRLIKYLLIFVVLSIILSRQVLHLRMIGSILSFSVLIVVVIIATLFPQELRRGLWKISSPKEVQESFSTQYDCSDEELKTAINDIVRAVQNMAKKDVGALIVIAPNTVPSHILESGTIMDAKLSCPLIECLFNTKAPLHDGAVFIRGNRIIAAGCFLPLSQDTNVPKELGTRHRAAIGVTENYNVLTIIVSEETGVISVANAGKLTRYYDSVMLTDTLEQVFGLKASAIETKKKKRKNNYGK